MKNIGLLITCIFLVSCGNSDTSANKAGLTLKSPAFLYGHKIPPEYTCDGGNVSPEMIWTGVPAGAKSLVLVCEDLAGRTRSFIHWVVYNIPPQMTGIPKDLPRKADLPNGFNQALNTRSQIGYIGPCPGTETHPYVFRLYALDDKIEGEPPLSSGKILALMEGHIIARTELLGEYR